MSWPGLFLILFLYVCDVCVCTVKGHAACHMSLFRVCFADFEALLMNVINVPKPRCQD